MRNVKLFLMVVCTYVSIELRGDTIFISKPDSTYEFFNQYIDIFQPTKQLSFDAIRMASIDSFFNHSKLNSHTFDLSKPTWGRLTVVVEKDMDRDWLWELYDYRHRSIELYMPLDSANYLYFKGGNSLPFYEKVYLHKNFVFDVPHWKKGVYHVYYKIQSNHTGSMRGVFRTSKTFSQYAMYEYFFLALFYGVLITLAVYNSLLFVASKDKVHIIYVAYVFSAIGFSLSRDGLGFQFIWPHLPSINGFTLDVFHFLIVLFTSILAGTFLELPIKKSKVLTSIVVLLFIRCLITILFFCRLLDISYALFIDLLIFSLIFIVSIVKFSFTSVNRFFVLAYTFLYLGFVVWELQHFGFVRHNFFTIYSINMGILLESLLLSLAIYDRIRLLRRTKEDVQKQMIILLEEKQYIEETYTKSLENLVNKQREELKTAVQEIHELNEQLNIQNKELRSKVESIEKDNIVGKILTYAAFTAIYDTQEKCLEVISDIKWAKGFVCTKCETTKYTLLKDTLARKCVKCRYTESPTKNTVLEGVKFPLNKAFYIIYILFFSRDKVTSTYLSKVMDLRQKTCWEFMEKVKQFKFDFKKQDGVSWLDIFA